MAPALNSAGMLSAGSHCQCICGGNVAERLGGGFVIWSSQLKPCTLLLTGFVLSSPLPPPVAAIVYSQLVCHKSVGIFKLYVY